jgi:hypothetical protein
MQSPASAGLRSWLRQTAAWSAVGRGLHSASLASHQPRAPAGTQSRMSAHAPGGAVPWAKARAARGRAEWKDCPDSSLTNHYEETVTSGEVVPMASWRTAYFAALPLAVCLTLLESCGGNALGTLDSIAVSPASASPSADGSVQFVATGHYINPSRTLSPVQVEPPMSTGWSYSSAVPGEKISLTQNGLATCSTPGTFVIAAWAVSGDGSACTLIGPGAAPCPSISGTAQLTCP